MSYIEIPVGPQHPALHEPILLRVKVDGEQVVEVEPVVGYNHRGIEKLCEVNSFIRDLYICGRVCGICNIVHATCYAQAIEEIMGREVPPRAAYLRVLVNELERIHSHMLILAVMAEIVGFESLFMLMMRDRERVMMLKELVTGNRVLADYIIFGGVKRDVTPEKAEKIKRELDYIEQRMKYYKSVFEEDYALRRRLEDTGRISAGDAVKYCFVGPVARGSGVRTDVRKEDPYSAYDEVPFELITFREGDSWARMMVRVEETFQSIAMIRYVLDHLPQGEIAPKAIPRKLPPGEAIARAEAPRGELTYHIVSNGKPMPYRVKIRTPSYLNIINSPVLFENAQIADVPVIFASLDPCISCMDRVLVVDVRKGKAKVFSMKQLSRGELRW